MLYLSLTNSLKTIFYKRTPDIKRLARGYRILCLLQLKPYNRAFHARIMWKVTLEDEYKKNPQLKGEDIQEVQVWIKKQPHLPSVTGKATQHFGGWAYIIFILEVCLLEATTHPFRMSMLKRYTVYSFRQTETIK